MDDRETPTNDLLLETQDGCHTDDTMESTRVRLPSVSDENENQLDENGCEGVTTSDNEMGKHEKFEQDNLNNNESCSSCDNSVTPSCEAAASDNSEKIYSEGPTDEKSLPGKEKKGLGKKNSRNKKGITKSTPGFSSGDMVTVIQEKIIDISTHAGDEEGAAESNANYQPKEPKQVLQSLFTLIRGEFEQLDSRILPLCLHQIAETYFQDEDYEKAMKFIQLERLYHEQLLANLSSIQDQWEAKWKTAEPNAVTSLRNSEKGLDGEEFERLAKLCTTHQEPLLSKHKIITTEKSVEKICFTQLTVIEDLEERGATTKKSENETWTGSEPRKENQPREEEKHEGSISNNQIDKLMEAGSLPVSANKDHMEEQQCSAESSLEFHTQPSETVGSQSGSDSSENSSREDSCLLLGKTEVCKDVAKREEIANRPAVLISGKSMVDPLIVSSSENIPLSPNAEDENLQTIGNELQWQHQDAPDVTAGEELEHNALNQQQSDLTDSDGKLPPENVHCENDKTSDYEHPKLRITPEEWGEEEEEEVNKETKDYLNKLLEGCLKDAVLYLPYEENQDDSDTFQDLSPEEASYSLQDTLPSDESFLSLDDLAKRIEIAEIVPTEGLVSILKKRNNSEGNQLTQMEQKPSKRRVRFQEMEDSLDQDEVGGGSCLLLVLLCIATVFLSVGGTALYCTFGDVESPVCTDFAANMDFYYTKLLQGITELKHWITFS
ncbi:consortin [Monodelphis domestica]|uniref:consortin n=1 Tax=Monodelphis domestica TaxID=13616 RepID=UPI0024E1AA03|nr:consortin [Monodelphis domestica]XP_056672029.1 consortin [Monodelphis domestica]